MTRSAHRGELRRLIKEFVALSDAEELSVDEISAFLFRRHGKLVEIEKARLFHNAIADVARSVLKMPQAVQQLMLPGFPDEAVLPSHVPVRSNSKNGKPVWKRPISMTGAEISARIKELKRPKHGNGELEAMKFLMSGLIEVLGEEDALTTNQTYSKVMKLDFTRKRGKP